MMMMMNDAVVLTSVLAERCHGLRVTAKADGSSGEVEEQEHADKLYPCSLDQGAAEPLCAQAVVREIKRR